MSTPVSSAPCRVSRRRDLARHQRCQHGGSRQDIGHHPQRGEATVAPGPASHADPAGTGSGRHRPCLGPGVREAAAHRTPNTDRADLDRRERHPAAGADLPGNRTHPRASRNHTHSYRIIARVAHQDSVQRLSPATPEKHMRRLPARTSSPAQVRTVPPEAGVGGHPSLTALRCHWPE